MRKRGGARWMPLKQNAKETIRACNVVIMLSISHEVSKKYQ